jgi:RNA polymerase sigma-70 factor (ECF subfamily)
MTAALLERDWSLASDNATLVRCVLAGDAAAFEAIMRRYNRRLYRLARATMRNDADAEDALQDAYVKAFNALAEFRGDASLSTWLARIVHNECMMRLRRDARRDNVIPMAGDIDVSERDLPDTSIERPEAAAMRSQMRALLERHLDELPDATIERPEAAAMRSQMRSLLERHLDDLPDALRTVFMMRAIDDMSVQEVAQCLGLSEVAVRSRHFRARSLLREALAREIDATEAGVFAFAGERCDRIVAGVLARIGATPRQ